ncbi:MAG: hypothetical protein KDJ99_11720, partial [Candidatus Competibacteraceae bacterium]|nr:hypothetical protein [Candidatus Competibacteraceae bacterium]
MPTIAPPGLVPADALDYFRAKAMKPAYSWEDVWREEHAAAFTVAKAMQLDVLRTLRAALVRALAEGRTFRDFANQLEPELQKLGWWGTQDVLDPLTGELISAELGSARRLRIIYDANLRAARAAGQWARIQRSKNTHPYLLYQLGPSREHRLQHTAWHGLLLPVDDPFWQTAMPPNGWGCKCRVRAVTERQYQRLQQNGIPSRDPENPGQIPVKTAAPAFQMQEYINKRTGEVLTVPRGIDPGWDYNPGQAGRVAALETELAGKRQQTAVVLGQTVPEPVWPAGSEPVYSTVAGVKQTEIERILRGIPAAGEQIEALARFLDAHPVKAVLLKQTEMSFLSQSAGRIEDAIRQFLGVTRLPQLVYTIRRPRHINGFTASRYAHVVTKVSARAKLAGTDPARLAQAVEQLVTNPHAG